MKLRRVVISTLAALVAAVFAFTSLPSAAQVPVPSLSPILTSPSPSPSPSPSDSPKPSPEPPPPPPSPEPQPAPSGEVPGPVASPAPTDVFPLEVPDLERTPSRSTNRLAEILMPLTERGMPLEEAMIIAAPPFPVAGLVWFSDDWMMPRVGPPPHLHEGTDIFATMGTPIVASGPGYVAGIGEAALGGTSVWIAGDEGTGYFYTHLSAYAEGLHLSQRVDVGSVIGYVGNSGNAATTPPHVHFEIHSPVFDEKGRMIAGGVTTMPDGTARTNTPAVNPKPILDQWLAVAESKAQEVVFAFIEKFNKISRQLHHAQRVTQMYSGEMVHSPDQLLWFSIFEPSLAALGIAKQSAITAAINGPPGSYSRSQAELQRLEMIRNAVEGPKLRFAALAGQFVRSSEQ